MGHRYILEVVCSNCGFKDDEVYYAPTCGFTTHACPKCGYVTDLEELTRISYEEASNESTIGSIMDVIELKERHKNTWRDRPQIFWAYRLCLEVCELLCSLLGIHAHKPEVELKQISAICMNWLEMREQKEHKKE